MTHVITNLKAVETSTQSKDTDDPACVRPPIPEHEIGRLLNLPPEEHRAAARKVADSIFEERNAEAIAYLGIREPLKLKKAEAEAQLMRCQRDLCSVSPTTIHYTDDPDRPPSHAARAMALALNIISAVTILSLVYVYAMWIVKTEMFDQITTIMAALPLALVPASAGVGLPLAYYYSLQSEGAKAKVLQDAIKFGLVLLLGLGASFFVATLLDTYVTDSAGHAASGVIMLTATSFRALALALCLPMGIGAEIAASIAIKIWAGKHQQADMARLVAINPEHKILQAAKDEQAARVALIDDKLARRDALESQLAVTREAFAVTCEAVLLHEAKRRRHAADGVGLSTGSTGSTPNKSSTQERTAA